MGRRRFLYLAGGAVGATVVSCGSLGAMQDSPIPAADFGEFSYGKENAMGKILVVYASMFGSTAEVAQAIAERLAQRSIAVDVQSVEATKDLSPYRAVVVGSAVRTGQWLPAAVTFVKQQRDALSRVPVAIFSVHGWFLDDSEASRQRRAAYTEPVRGLLTPRHEAFFAGKFDPGKLGFGARLAFGVMGSLVGAPKGDLRNWAAIRAWVDQIFPAAGQGALGDSSGRRKNADRAALLMH